MVGPPESVYIVWECDSERRRWHFHGTYAHRWSAQRRCKRLIVTGSLPEHVSIQQYQNPVEVNHEDTNSP